MSVFGLGISLSLLGVGLLCTRLLKLSTDALPAAGGHLGVGFTAVRSKGPSFSMEAEQGSLIVFLDREP